MPDEISVNPFRCKMWAGHERLHLSSQVVRLNSQTQRPHIGHGALPPRSRLLESLSS